MKCSPTQLITPEEIRQLTLKKWDQQLVQQAYLSHGTVFPLVLRNIGVSPKIIQQHFGEIQKQLNRLDAESKAQKGHGYMVEKRLIQSRLIGEQWLPEKVVVETLDDFLKLIHKKREYQEFCKAVDLILGQHPQLRSWLLNKPRVVLEYRGRWEALLAVVRYFWVHPRPNRYLRELDIKGVHSKFIENHRRILKELLDQVLPEAWIQTDVTQLSQHGFERRFGLKYEEPLIRFRMLDDTLSEKWGFHDVTLPLSEFRTLDLPCQRVFVTENKINGLSFPKVSGSIVVFGLGYGIESLKDIKWLHSQELVYWGDIDTHGFSILSQMRSLYDHTQSIMMDSDTLQRFCPLWVQEDIGKRCLHDLPHLTLEEQSVFHHLRNDVWGERVRLEQERIDYQYVCQQLENFVKLKLG